MRRIGIVATALVLVSASAGADPLPQRGGRLLTPGRTAASDDTSNAIRINPANLGYLPAWELRYDGVYCPDTAQVQCGHAISAATPLFGGLSSGLRVDWITPSANAPPFYGGASIFWLTWGLGWRMSRSISFGASMQGSFSSNAVTSGLFGLSAAATWRPHSVFGLSVVAQDFTRPTAANFPGNGNGLAVLDPSFVAAAVVRPFQKRVVEVGVDATYYTGTNDFVPRGTIAFDIPHLGRMRGDVSFVNIENDAKRGVMGTIGLELALSHFTAGGGAMLGNGLGSSSDIAGFATASIAGYTQPGAPPPTQAVSIRIETTPGPRGHVALLRKLWKIAKDPNIAGVALVLRTEPASSFAHAEELADAIRLVRAYGKKVLCSWEDNGSRSLYVCANADLTVVNPAGGLRYSGLKATYLYLANLLAKIGVKAEVVRIGAHKSAPEQFTNDKASDVARADHEDMLRNIEAVFVKNVAVGRKKSESDVRQATLKGPFIAQEAKDAGFVDRFAFDDELERVMKELVGRNVSMSKYDPEQKAPEYFGPRDRLAILYVDGDMVDGRSQKFPLLGIKTVGSYSMAETIHALRDDSAIKAVVLRIESPGGSSMAADVMWRELKLLADRKPLIVSMGGIAASGGYYIAVPAKRIFALPLTITGSIGIFYGKADLSGLLDKIGVTTETYKTTPRADAESLFRGFTQDERDELQRKIGQFYDVFISRVAEGRHMTKEQVDAVGQGRVWMGQQAVQNGLVDEMGGLREALDAARKLGQLPLDAPIVEVPSIDKTLFEQALDMAGVPTLRAGTFVDGLPVQLTDLARAVSPLIIHSKETPMARLEWVPLEDDIGTDPDE